MNHWLRLIGYGLTAGTWLKLTISLAPGGIVPGMPLGAMSFALFGLCSIGFCPIIAFANRNRVPRALIPLDRAGKWYLFATLVAFLILTVIPILLGFRHLWWLGLICPNAAAEATLSPQKPFDAVDLFDSLLNLADKKEGRT